MVTSLSDIGHPASCSTELFDFLAFLPPTSRSQTDVSQGMEGLFDLLAGGVPVARERGYDPSHRQLVAKC